ncbi:MAG TPA: hypothetical protein VLK82_24445 [Candidatus Tectomicrobia bacterium]|nr:hypothetical protein [Candidatus Tectomicrobia bacterium]
MALEALLQSVQVLAATSGDSPLPGSLGLAEKDRPILAMAVAARATHLLTGDMRHFGRYYSQIVAGVLILPPAAYLRAWARGGERMITSTDHLPSAHRLHVLIRERMPGWTGGLGDPYEHDRLSNNLLMEMTATPDAPNAEKD